MTAVGDPGAASLQRTGAAYDAAADHFDAAPLQFWDRYGRRTVARLALRPGQRVLDVCCGTGASALPAARAVGPRGRVVAVDLSARLLEQAAAKARAEGLGWVDFQRADMAELRLPARHFDAVVCVFGIFFAADMVRQVRSLWRRLRPGGRLALTIWGPSFFAPAYTLFLDAVRRLRPDLADAFRPWDRVQSAPDLRHLFAAAGLDDVQVVDEPGSQPLAAPEQFWTVALGTGLRWTIDQLLPGEAQRVRDEVVGGLRAAGSEHIATNVVYGIATRR
ncbi:MAG: methyltransferase domain-containing protein [Planctomycetes bacterium]|nr:methyltransferase domain-containing protein [Planctomycetota bacterium]